MPKTRRQEVHHLSGAVLLDAADLEKSEVVANACMNRARNLAGSNSYEKDLGFCPLDFLSKVLETQPHAAWLDLCCGTGRALIHAAGLADGRLQLTGVDLIPMFDPIPPSHANLTLVAASAETWDTGERFDLITCVHGLHYVGDKLRLLQKSSGWLKDRGLLAAHLDYRNLRISCRASAGSQIGRDLRSLGFQYSPARRLLTLRAPASPYFLPYRYLGADDQAGPNYTGQPAVDSYYVRSR